MALDMNDPRDRELLIVTIVVASSFVSIAFFIVQLPPIVVIVPSLIAIIAGLYLVRWLSRASQAPGMPQTAKRSRRRKR